MNYCTPPKKARLIFYARKSDEFHHRQLADLFQHQRRDASIDFPTSWNWREHFLHGYHCCMVHHLPLLFIRDQIPNPPKLQLTSGMVKCRIAANMLNPLLEFKPAANNGMDYDITKPLRLFSPKWCGEWKARRRLRGYELGDATVMVPR